MPRANTTADAILGLLALRGSWTATELTAQIGRNMRFFWLRRQLGVPQKSPPLSSVDGQQRSPRSAPDAARNCEPATASRPQVAAIFEPG